MRLWQIVQRLWKTMLARLFSLLGEASGTTLAFTGILGLAAVLYTLYQLRSGQGRKRDEPSSSQQQPPLDPTQPSTSAAGAAAAAAAAAASKPAAGPAAAATPAAAVARRLAGIRCVTLSVPGVLLEESSPAELEESASVRAGAADLVREVARVARVYLMCHVSDDIGEAVVRGALEHAGLLGANPGQVPPHRALFCGTLDGKVSLVRQLEPDLHIDGHEKTVSDLQRFVKQLVLVQQPGAAGSSLAAAGNIQLAPSLGAALGLA
ncbi:hypothetical protein ABPG75_001544 [Micractinium tetrahymenae]